MNQSQNKIQNPKTQVPKTPQMNDRDFCNDILATEKYLTNSYSTAIHEASHQALYDDIKMILNETNDCSRNLFNIMFKNGWYKFEAEEQQKLQQTYQQFYNYTTTQFPN